MTKAEKTQLLFFIQNGVTSSCGLNGMSEQWARLEKRLPVPGDHARILSLLQELRDKGLIYAQEAFAKGKIDVLVRLELTDEGTAALYRLRHPLWVLGCIWKEIKDILTSIAAKRLEP